MAAGEDVNQFAALLGAYPFQREVLDQVVSFVHGHPSAFPLARATLEPSYTYDDGREEACVIQLHGGVTMTYNGQQYKLPAVIVLPHGFPREAPIVRMTPRAGMVRNERSSCVDGSLRVVGGYIEKWEYPFSSLGRLYADMKEAFGKSPPLRQQTGGDRGRYGGGYMKKKEKHALVTLLHRLVNESLEVEYVCLASAMEQEVGAGVVWEERLKEMRGAVADMEGRIAELGKTNEMLTWWLEQAEDKLRACRVTSSRRGFGFGFGRGAKADGDAGGVITVDAIDVIDAYEAAAPMRGPAREEMEAAACVRAVQEAVLELDGALALGRLTWGGYKRLLSQLMEIKFQARVVERQAASERRQESTGGVPSTGENGGKDLDCSSWTYPEVEDALEDEAIGRVDRGNAGDAQDAYQDLLGENPLLRRGRFRDMVSSSKIFRSMP